MAYEKYIIILSTIYILVVIILFNFISFQELFRPGTHHFKIPLKYFEINHDLGEPSKEIPDKIVIARSLLFYS